MAKTGLDGDRIGGDRYHFYKNDFLCVSSNAINI